MTIKVRDICKNTVFTRSNISAGSSSQSYDYLFWTVIIRIQPCKFSVNLLSDLVFRFEEERALIKIVNYLWHDVLCIKPYYHALV